MDESLDQLANASWIFSLDQRAGFHKIGLKKGEEFKMAFQTHFGPFEFRVMGLCFTDSHGIFQHAMNSTLAPKEVCFGVL